jgi:hypothetical protein
MGRSLERRTISAKKLTGLLQQIKKHRLMTAPWLGLDHLYAP